MSVQGTSRRWLGDPTYAPRTSGGAECLIETLLRERAYRRPYLSPAAPQPPWAAGPAAIWGSDATRGVRHR